MDNNLLSKLRAYYTAKYFQRVMEFEEAYLDNLDKIHWEISGEGEDLSEGAWVLRGDRGLTYEQAPPENATLTEGRWWPSDYSGEPLVSFSAEEAAAIGLKLGDTVTVNVLGRNITARIASFRQVEWESMGINFVMIFSPNTFAGAPHS